MFNKKMQLTTIHVKSFSTFLKPVSGETIIGGALSVNCDPDWTGQNTLCTDFMCLTLAPACPNSQSQ